MVKPIDIGLDPTLKQMDLRHGGWGVKMSRDEYLEFVTKTFKEMEDIIQRKNADYTNGAGPFANFEQSVDFGVDPFVGLMVRVGDKFQRIKSYCKQGGLQVQNEGIDDALRDLIGYSLIGLGMLKDKGNK